MQQDTGVTAIAHVIQLAVAPVFLLTGIGAMLSVMASRLGRIVDRAPALEGEEHRHGGSPQAGVHHAGVVNDLRTLSRRARLISRAITLSTITASLVCAVIVVLFVGAFLNRNTSSAVAGLFVAAMLAFLVALLLFLREVLLATATLRIGLEAAPAPAAPPAAFVLDDGTVGEQTATSRGVPESRGDTPSTPGRGA